MAGLTDQRKKLLQQAAGLTTLHTGAPTSAVQMNEHNDAALRYLIKDLRGFVDRDSKMLVEQEQPSFFGRLFSFSEEPAQETLRTKENLKQLIGRQLDGQQTAPLAPHEVTAVKAAMSVAAYPVNLDEDTFSPEELQSLPRFNDNLDSLSLQQIANSNFITATESANRLAAQATAQRQTAEQQAETQRVAAEQAAEAATQTETLRTKVAAGLVYGGYLDEENAGNKIAVAHAMKRFMTIVTPYQDLASEEAKIFNNFDDWEVTPYALEYVGNKLSPKIAAQNDLRNGSLLKDHLESGNPELIKLAQAELSKTNPDVQINGVIDAATMNAGNEALRAPLSVPDELIGDDGKVRFDNLLEMSVRGQLYLPIEALSEEQQQIAMSYPLAADREPHQTMSREKFIALRLIDDDPNPPAKYQAVLDAENARRANVSLELEMGVPAVVVPESTPVAEETSEIAQNPAMLAPVENNDAVVDAAQPIVDHSAANATGITTQSGILVFDGQEVALDGIVAALKQDQGAYGDGVADNQITLAGAINLVRGAVGANNAGLASMPLSPDNVAAISASMGYEANHKFDLADPHEMAAVLKGVISHQNVSAAAVPFTDEFIAANTTVNNPDVAAAIDAAAGVTQPSAPEAPALASPNGLKGTFTGAALGIEVMSPEEVAQHAQQERKMAANFSGGPLPMVG